MIHGSLFSGIGGFDLGFQRAGIETAWQVEIDPYCRRVLARHFPEAERFHDITRAALWDDERFRLINRLAAVDVLSGGFPCQDISSAGKREGIDGERSGLWSEYARIIGELRPRFVVVENVAALLGRGMERVLGDLASLGYDAEWQSIRASDAGAPHIRERIWILAYPESSQRWPLLAAWDFSYRDDAGWKEAPSRPGASRDGGPAPSDRRGPVLADSKCDGREQGTKVFRRRKPVFADGREDVSDSEIIGCDRRVLDEPREWPARRTCIEGSNPWAIEPDVGRVADGIPARVDRLRGLGNAIVPQIAEWIGRQIMNSEMAPSGTRFEVEKVAL